MAYLNSNRYLTYMLSYRLLKCNRWVQSTHQFKHFFQNSFLKFACVITRRQMIRSPLNMVACSVNSSPYNELIKNSILEFQKLPKFWAKIVFYFYFETSSFCQYLLHLYIVLQRYFLGFFHGEDLNQYSSGIAPFLASLEFVCNSQNIFFPKMFWIFSKHV